MPEFYHYDTNNNLLVIDDGRMEKLWELPSSGIVRLNEDEGRSHNYRVQITDLSNDGKKEVITTIPLPGDERETGGSCGFSARREACA